MLCALQLNFILFLQLNQFYWCILYIGPQLPTNVVFLCFFWYAQMELDQYKKKKNTYCILADTSRMCNKNEIEILIQYLSKTLSVSLQWYKNHANWIFHWWDIANHVTIYALYCFGNPQFWYTHYPWASLIKAALTRSRIRFVNWASCSNTTISYLVINDYLLYISNESFTVSTGISLKL